MFYFTDLCLCMWGWGGGYIHPFSAQNRATGRIEHGSSDSEGGPELM